MAAVFIVVAAVIGLFILLVGFLVVFNYKRKILGDKIVNQVVKQYLIGKRDRLTIDEIEERLASQNGIELLEPYSRHLERESSIFSLSDGCEMDDLKEILVLQRITFDIFCAYGLYPRPTGNMLTPQEHENMKLLGDRVARRLQQWQSSDADACPSI